LFTFDFSLVYWNSRLHHEHERIIASLKPDEVVIDAMAGVGPFAVPAAKKGCSVYGNDLNPESVKWMEVNRVKNKVSFKRPNAQMTSLYMLIPRSRRNSEYPKSTDTHSSSPLQN
jgi:tRNA (guanine37-N1)-methyltransferase